MELRKRLEEAELENLSPFASKSALSKGREIPEESCDIRTEFQRDRDRIIHSNAFRRLKDKMQVFIASREDHIRTRLLHTLEVSQIARTIARALRLNEDLTEAIALGHDLGHTPFGHAGEYALNEICPYGFEHNKQSLRVVERLEKNGKGLRLTWEVRDGILNHRTGMTPSTLEGKIVQISDKIAYLNHDIEDAVKSGTIKLYDVPKYCVEILGDTGRKRINTMTRAVISESFQKNDIFMEKTVKNAVSLLRDFMFENVYLADSRLEEKTKITHVITELYNYYFTAGSGETAMFAVSHSILDEKPEIVICDYIAGMTDGYALNKYGEVFLPMYKGYFR